jgi:hypothetical protein
MIADEPDFIRLADLGVEAVEGDACAPSTDVLVGSLRTPEGSSIKKSLFTNLRGVNQLKPAPGIRCPTIGLSSPFVLQR